MKYKCQPSIIMIKENASFESQFRFRDVSENDIKQEVLNLNSRKPGTFSYILTKILRSSFDVSNLILLNMEF